jgi:aminodeoxyfutalosine synthase
MLRGLKQRFPHRASEGFHHGGGRISFRRIARRLTVEEVLRKDERTPAWIPAPAAAPKSFIRACASIICDHKISGDHVAGSPREKRIRLGLHSNCHDALRPHVETEEEDRVDHLVKLRELQDETQGFVSVHPAWRFTPTNTALSHIPKTSGYRRSAPHRRSRA